MPILFILFYALAAQADWTKIPSADFALPPPPVLGSAASQMDFDVLLENQRTRTEAQCERAREMVTPSYDAIFGELFGAKENKRVKGLIREVMELTERVSGKIKEQYMRPRPYNVDARIVPCIVKPKGSKSYPSSHASMTAAGACVLALIFPERAVEITEYGEAMGELRMIAGVHHPSDVDAGQQLASMICARLQGEPDFQKDLDKVR